MGQKKPATFRQFAQAIAEHHMKEIKGKAPEFLPFGHVNGREEYMNILKRLNTEMTTKPEGLYSEFTLDACPITSNN